MTYYVTVILAEETPTCLPIVRVFETSCLVTAAKVGNAFAKRNQGCLVTIEAIA